MIISLHEIKRHPDDNRLFGGLDDGWKSDEWEDGGRDAVGVKTLSGCQRSAHPTAYTVILTEPALVAPR